jgi:hypothetical protein
MLAQLNFFKSFGYWNGKIGDSQNVTLENITDDDVTAKVLPRFKTIAEKIMNAHCGRKNPLACLNSNAYPTLWENRRLLLISWVTEANSFSSFHAERIHCPGINERGEEPACIEDDNAKYPLAIGISGAIDNTGSTSRALVVGSSEVAGAWVRFQCPLGEVEIVPNDPNNLRLQVGNNFCCRECTNRRYWNCERSAPTPRVCHASNECIPPCYVRECADPVQPCEFS